MFVSICGAKLLLSFLITEYLLLFFAHSLLYYLPIFIRMPKFANNSYFLIHNLIYTSL